MIVNQTPYPINFEMKMSQALTCRYGEVSRQYKFIADIDLTGLSANLRVIKPDGTFVIEAASITVTEDEQYIVVEIPLQATVVKGVCRYDINIYNDDDLLLYTAEGPLWVDDQLITEDMIESVAEVYGLRFPQDFLTVENLVDIVHYVQAEIIKDDVIAEDTTWSSQKIEQEISGAIPEITGTAEGNPIELTDAAAAPLVKCVTEIQGSQDLHGYDKPWVGGAGKNKFTIPGYSGSTYSNVTYTFDADTNTLSKSGTSSGSAGTNVGTISLANGTYTFSAVFEETGSGTSIYLRDVNTNTNVAFVSNYTRQTTIQLDGNYYVRLATETGATSGSIKNIQLELGSTATTFEPYSNICPITAYTEGEIEVSDGDGNTNTSTATFTNDIYKGSADFVNCTATTEWGMIASYAGETLPGEWISDRDEYVPGTTPTTGAQVAYELATPTTSSVTTTNLPIRTLSGYTHIESSTGDMEVEYLTQTYDPIAELIDRSSLHVYSTEEKVVGKWIDGRNVYEKSWEFDNYVNIPANSIISLASKGVIISGVDFFVKAICISRVDKRVHFPFGVGIYDNAIGIQNVSSGSMAIDKIVLQYIKNV